MLNDRSEVSPTVRQLQQARALLEDPRRWCKGAARKGDRFCVSRAVIECVPDWRRYRHVRDANNYLWPPGTPRHSMPEANWFLRAALYLIDPTSDGRIYRWNDASERTHGEVLALIDMAVEIALEDADYQAAA